MLSSHRRCRALLSSALAASAFFGLPAAGSQAAGVSGGPCTPGPSSAPFLPWGDANAYTLVPGGDIEGSLPGWTLQGGAAPTGGSEPYGVTGSVGSSSLVLPAGSVVTSAASCVNVSKPTADLFVRTGTPGTAVTVSVVYVNNGGNVVASPFAVIRPGASWQPSGALQLPTLSAPGQTAATGYVALQFSTAGGSAQIDDVYIDPWGGW